MDHATVFPGVSDESPTKDMANAKLGALRVREGDVDWFVFEAKDASSNPLTPLQPGVQLWTARSSEPVPKSTNLRVCAFVKRDELKCLKGRGLRDGHVPTMLGCCADPTDLDAKGHLTVTLDLETLGKDDTSQVYVRVESFAKECSNYDLYLWGTGSTSGD
jgi:hypothetical protein